MKVGSISGSLTRLVDNTSYLIEGANITITTGSNGAITISSTGGGGGSGDAYFDSTVAGSIFTSGSAAFIGNQDEWGVIDSPVDKGTDVFFYVSGSIGSKNGPSPGVSLFSGDMVVSGSFFSEGDTLEVTGTVTAVHGFSGSLTTLADGTSYLIAGNNITIVTQSNGSVVISSTASGTGDSYFDSTVAGSIFTTGSAAFVDQESVTSPSDKGTDVFFYVSGSIGSKDGPTPGVALFSGDVVVSGSMFAEGNRFEMSGTLLVTEGISGSLTTLVDGTSYLVAGDNISIVSQSNGSILISSVPAQTDDFFDSTTVGSIFTTGSAAFKDQEAISSPADKGTDVFFYVSGSIGSKDGPSPGVALFSGDLAVSGSLFAIGDVLEISGTLSVSEGISGSLTTLADGTSYLIAGDNISIVSQSNGSILISSTFTQVDDFFDSTTAGSIFTTGSAAFKGQESIDSPADKGTDVFFYVSGSIGSKDGPSPGVALFSGDVVVSGSMFASGDRLEMSGTLLVTEGISGSLTNLTDGTSYLVAGDNISIVSQSNGSILISNTFVQVDDFFDSTTAGSIFTTGSAAFKDQESIDSPSDKGTDVFFYVSGSIGSKDGSTPGVALFGGDVVVSGSMFTQGDVLEVTGTLIVTNGISGSLTTLADGTSYLVAGDNISIVSQSNGSILISNTFSQVDDFFDSTTAGSIFTTGSAAFKGQESIDSPLDKGADVFFYVSGSIGSQGTSTAGAALFGGDLVVSGGILLTGNFLEVTGTIAATQGISGSLTQLVDGTSYLIAGANISITSQSNGAVTISNTFQQADDFFDSTTAGSIFTTGSTAFKGQESIDSPTDKGTDVFFYASGSVAATRSAVSLFGGFVVISGSMVQGNFGASGGTTGQYSRAHGERTSVTGIAAHAEGRFTLAQGNYSHAEGDSTFASGPGSHAEGLDSATYASYSHAEGRSTEARGVYSHAEGYDSIPRADYSHAEGRDTETIIGALYSHAEGSGSITLGEASHAGGLCTIASGSFQTVFGKYNLRSNVDSLFIIGNGTADSNANRSDVVRVQPGTLGAGQLQVSGSMSVSGSYSGNTNTLSGTGTIDSAGHSMLLTSTGGSQAITLADGTWPGQLKYVVANSGYSGVAAGSIITPTNALGYTSVTFDTNGQAVTFFWTGTKWVIVGSYGATITP